MMLAECVPERKRQSQG